MEDLSDADNELDFESLFGCSSTAKPRKNNSSDVRQLLKASSRSKQSSSSKKTPIRKTTSAKEQAAVSGASSKGFYGRKALPPANDPLLSTRDAPSKKSFPAQGRKTAIEVTTPGKKTSSIPGKSTISTPGKSKIASTPGKNKTASTPGGKTSSSKNSPHNSVCSSSNFTAKAKTPNRKSVQRSLRLFEVDCEALNFEEAPTNCNSDEQSLSDSSSGLSEDQQLEQEQTSSEDEESSCDIALDHFETENSSFECEENRGEKSSSDNEVLMDTEAVDTTQTAEAVDATPATADMPEMSGAVQEIIRTVTQHMDQRMNRMATELKCQISSVSTPNKRSKSKSSVPLIVKSEVRKMYKLLLDQSDEEFEGFDFSPSVPFNDPANEAVVSKLIKEVCKYNSEFQSSQVRAAAYTYYRSQCQQESRKRRGIYDVRNKTRRRRERLSRKLQERLSIFKKLNMPSKAKDKWMKVFRPDVMSSEDSCSDSEDIFVKPILWRAHLVDKFFKELDKKSMELKSPQARRQRKNRVGSTTTSTRTVPADLPRWAVKA